MKVVSILSMLLIICFCIAIGPWCFIWAINILVKAGGVSFTIPFNVLTWLAALIVGGLQILPMARRR